MDPEKTQEERGHDPRDSPRRRSLLPASLSLRSSSKRRSILEVIEPETEQEPEQQQQRQATCQESTVYPVFNPRDPDHNPWLRPLFHRRPHSMTSSSEAQKPSWVQDLPRRSLHKARSGFLALRAGWSRRSTRTESELDNPAIEPPRGPGPEGNRRGDSSHGLSNGSTQADSSVGVRLYRVGTPWPSLTETESETSNRVDDAHEMMGIISAPEVDASDVIHGESAARNPVNVSPDEPPAYFEGYNGAPDIRPRHLDTSTKAGYYTYEHSGEVPRAHTFGGLHRVDNSGNLQVMASPRGNADSQNGEVAGPCGLCNPVDVSFEGKNDGQGVRGEASMNHVTSKIRRFRLSSSLDGASEVEFPEVAPQITNALAVFKRPHPDVPRVTIESNHDHARQQVATNSDAEQQVTQETGRLYQKPITPESGASFNSQATKTSAEVKIAFPGVYQELLDQWEREEYQDSARNLHTEAIPEVDFSRLDRELLDQWEREARPAFACSLHAPGNLNNCPRPISQGIPPQQALEMQPPISAELPVVRSERTRLEATRDPINRPTRGASLMFSSRRQDMAGEQSMWPEDSRSQVFATSTYTGNAPWLTHTHPPTDAETEPNHLFGLHMSLRNDPAERNGSRERGSTGRRQQISFRTPYDQTPYDYQYISTFIPDVTVGSPFGESSSGSSFTRNSNDSVGVTSRSSFTSHTFSPLDSPIDEEVLFPSSLRDEYYMVDGKISSFYPDRGDQPVKATRFPAHSADGVCDGLGLSWARPSRHRRVPLMAPTNSMCEPQPASRGNMDRGVWEPVDAYSQRYLAPSHLR